MRYPLGGGIPSHVEELFFDNPRASEALAEIELHSGWSVRLVEWCEDARTPGLLGQIRGVTDWERKEVKISFKVNHTPALIADVLEHELSHVRNPDWDCGNRDVLGRGGPSDEIPTTGI